MKRILVGALAGIGALVILLVVVVLGVGGLAWTRTGTVPAKTILEVNFTHGFQEQTPDDPVTGLLLAKPPTVRDVVEALHRAATDDRVVALIAQVGSAPVGLAQLQEIRDAVLAFRDKWQARGGLCCHVRGIQCGQWGLLSRHGLRHHLPAALRGCRSDWPDRRDAIRARHARPSSISCRVWIIVTNTKAL